MTNFNRKARRAIERRAFKENIDVTDAQEKAVNERIRQVANKVAAIYMQATCLAMMFNYKKISGRENRIKNIVKCIDDYTQKLKTDSLTPEEKSVVQDVELALLERFAMKKEI